MDLAALFPDEDYRFHMRMARGTPEEFFAATPGRDRIVAERARWLRTSPGTYAACRAGGAVLLSETIESLRGWKILSPENVQRLAAASSVPEQCAALGEMLEPDFLFLKPNAQGEFELQGGCVCFPSSWSLAEKIGRPLEAIHGPVPGLNSSIGSSLQAFLHKLPAGPAWLRHNWGLSRSAELNQHPERHLPRLDETSRPEDAWLRVEHQALVALPQSRGILFAIRIAMHPLAEVKRNEEAARRFLRALQTMPGEMARYKNIDRARPALVAFLSQ